MRSHGLLTEGYNWEPYDMCEIKHRGGLFEIRRVYKRWTVYFQSEDQHAFTDMLIRLNNLTAHNNNVLQHSLKIKIDGERVFIKFEIPGLRMEGLAYGKESFTVIHEGMRLWTNTLR